MWWEDRVLRSARLCGNNGQCLMSDRCGVVFVIILFLRVEMRPGLKRGQDDGVYLVWYKPRISNSLVKYAGSEKNALEENLPHRTHVYTQKLIMYHLVHNTYRRGHRVPFSGACAIATVFNGYLSCNGDFPQEHLSRQGGGVR
ncbi:hypothetical protein HNY73_006917 [Argiope bruennichi]|uniref:Uncharacterized protein n=1 Tax=Argiope bruennichi TaxID=94029 RepID=A0A8T0FHG7_ARGBR|nr:hypothetical protein HNY73_006917 [Argiope bruennichi]